MIRQLLFWTKPLRYLWDRLTYPRSEREYIATLKNRYAGKPLLVVGNGPSLNKTPLERFQSTPSIGMNKINLLFDQTKWRPDLIVCTNNLVARQNERFFSTSPIPIFLSWKTRFFISSNARDNVGFFLSANDVQFRKDIDTCIGEASTVTYIALQFAYYLGANPVILFGVDHSFSISDTSKSNSIEKMSGEDNNHFHKDYFSKGQYWGIPNLDMSEKGYQFAREAFEGDGRKILDATINGKLNVFPKITLDEAVKICSPRNTN